MLKEEKNSDWLLSHYHEIVENYLTETGHQVTTSLALCHLISFGNANRMIAAIATNKATPIETFFDSIIFIRHFTPVHLFTKTYLLVF